MLAANRLPAPITRRIKQSLDAVKLWGKLDGRTRSNVQSILLTVLNPLLSSRAGLLFAAQGRPTFLPEVVVNQGGVVVVSINALTEPALARLVFRLVKNDFYECAQRRLAGPLCGLIMDENPLAASLDDLENLQTLRSRGAFVIAATQGFLALDQMVGVRIRQALVAGFQNIIAMQSHEPEVDLLMAIIMGEPRIVEPPPVLCLIQDDFAAGFVRVRHNSRDSQNLQTLNPPVVHDLHRHPAMLMLVLFNGSFFDAG